MYIFIYYKHIINMTLSESIIDTNLRVFLKLKRYEKLMIDANHNISIDMRYFQFIRRQTDQLWSWQPSTRQSCLEVIRLTYDGLKHYPIYYQTNLDLIIQSLLNLRIELSITYLDFTELLSVINQYVNIFTTYQSQHKTSLPLPPPKSIDVEIVNPPSPKMSDETLTFSNQQNLTSELSPKHIEPIEINPPSTQPSVQTALPVESNPTRTNRSFSDICRQYCCSCLSAEAT